MCDGMGIVCPVCGMTGTTEEMDTGVWFCHNCKDIVYIDDKSVMVPDFDIEDYIDDEAW